MAAIRNGGIVSIAIAMPRYVDPQTRYRTQIPAQIAAPDGRTLASGFVVGIVGWSKMVGV
jgi:hypothetical protein